MKYPSSIKIGYRDYEVFVAPADRMPDAMGTYNSFNGEIIMADNLSPQQGAQVLLHEIFHGLYEHGTMHEGTINEERTVETFANGFAGVIRDNPGFAKWLDKHLAPCSS